MISKFLSACAMAVCGLYGSEQAQTSDPSSVQRHAMQQSKVRHSLTGAPKPKAGRPNDARPFKDMPSFVAWMRATHKAPFYGPLPPAERRRAVEAIARQLSDLRAANQRDYIQRTPEQFGNIKVNTDLNPYGKAVTGLDINPADGSNFVVANYNSAYVTTTAGRTWTGDFTPTLPVNRYVDGGITTIVDRPDSSSTVGVSIDRSGTTYNALNINEFSPEDDSGYNFDEFAEVAYTVGHNHGLTMDQPTVVTSSDCDTSQRCDAVVETKGIVTDHSGTASDGATYLWYTYFCNSDPYIGCPDGIDFGDSVVIVENVAGPSSGFYFMSDFDSDVGDASVVVDSLGQPHVIQISYAGKPDLQVLLDDKFANLFSFAQEDSGLSVIDCTAHAQTAYCVFQTTRAGSDAQQPTASIYLAAMNLTSGATTVTRVNNDALGDGKVHFDPHVAVNSSGEIYVGWFDNRNDPTNMNFNYFVGKSVDGGKKFAVQKPINDVPFRVDPFTYTSFTSGIAAGPDGAVHAVWTDTREGGAPQIWTQVLRF